MSSVVLRTPNTPASDPILLAAVRTVMVGYPTPNTLLAQTSSDGTGLSATDNRVFIRDKWRLVAQDHWPAANLSMGGEQHRKRNSRSTYTADPIHVRIDWFNRWDQRPDTITDLFNEAAADVERIAANLESNETLTIGATSYAINIIEMIFPDDSEEIDEKSLPGLQVVCRHLTVVYRALPYDV